MKAVSVASIERLAPSAASCVAYYMRSRTHLARCAGQGDRRPPSRALPAAIVAAGRRRFLGHDHVERHVSSLPVRGEPAILAEPLRRAAADLGLPVTSVTPLETVVDELVRPQRLGRALLTGLGVVALVVTLVGIYGSVSSAVTRRSRDAGIRLALGASRAGVAASTMTPMLVVVMLGLVLGAVAASGSGRLVDRFLYGIDSSDPGTPALVLLLISTIAAAAAAIPTLRIFRIDPAEALRVDH
jgi:hypothetical protein